MAHLHSIYLTDEAEGSVELPWQIDRNIESFRHHHPEFAHTLYGNESGRAFIERHFDREVLEAYDELVPFSYKSDMLRFCLLYELGGIYADVSINFFAALEALPTAPKTKLFRARFSQAPWIVNTALVYSPGKVELFENCIRQIVENTQTGYYGFNPLCPTGPNLLGAQVAKWGRLDAMEFGEAVSIAQTNGGQQAGHAYVSSEQVLVGVVGKTRSGLASLGSGTQNNYNDFYHRHKIYRRELGKPDVWTAQDYRDRGIMNPSTKVDDARGLFLFPKGCALYGPYISLPAGEYRARFCFRGDIPEGVALNATIDVFAKGEQVAAAQPVQPAAADEGFELVLPFSLDRAREEVEIRFFLEKRALMAFDRMELVSEADGDGVS